MPTAQSETAPQTSRQAAVWIACGFIMSVGMSIGGMGHVSSLFFFDPLLTGHFERFDWSMLVLFCAGVVPTFLYWQLFKRGPTPWFDTKWHVPTDNTVDRGLVLGSAIFGMGWALGGFCPGPPVAGFLTGQPNYVAFSYGMYVSEVFVALRSRQEKQEELHWPLTVLLGTVPAVFYLLGPRLFPVANAPHLMSWPLSLSVLGGLGIGVAAILLFQFNGRVLGLSGIWRHVLDVRQSTTARLQQLLFFAAFMSGAATVYAFFPGAFAVPPYGERALGWLFLGGVLVSQGTRWANGCTSGHGICGLARLSVRSLIAVPTFMAAVFVCVPLFNTLLGR